MAMDRLAKEVARLGVAAKLGFKAIPTLPCPPRVSLNLKNKNAAIGSCKRSRPALKNNQDFSKSDI